MFSFEYPFVLALIIIAFACLFFCQEKKLSIYFPYSNSLKTIAKSKQLLRNVLKFLALGLVIVAIKPHKVLFFFAQQHLHWYDWEF
jgi:Ca-activated chloride channel family protein